jgi:ABC-type uncharacterized transport system substrate-binding protein
MRRRDFIAGLGGAAAWPMVARAQRSAVRVIGYLSSASLEPSRDIVAALHPGLADTGYFEGRNVAIEYRWADNHNDRLPTFALELARRPVAVIIAQGSTPAALAAKAVTSTIPIVCFAATDPVASGLVASLAQPGGNVTGISNFGARLIAKRLEILHELVPTANSIAVLVNPDNAPVTEAVLSEGQTAARALGVNVLILYASRSNEIEPAFETLVRQGAGAILVGADSLFSTHVEQLVALAAKYSIPASFETRAFTAAGGLMSYGPDMVALSRQLGIYTGRILNGEQPADLPVQQPPKFEMVFNRKTAKELGIEVPTPILLQATEVIE